MAMLSIWGIALVILIHSGLAEIGEPVKILRDWIYSFIMPLFFFISGYLFSLTNPIFLKIDYKNFILKKIKRLLIPYFIIGLFVILSNNINNITSFTWHNLRSYAYPRELGLLWYVATLFQIFFIVLSFSKIFHLNLKNNTTIFVCIIFCLILFILLPPISFLNIRDMIYFNCFFLLGIFSQVNDNVMLKLSTPILGVGGGIITIIMSTGILIIENSISLILIRFIVACAGITFSIFICSFILTYCKRISQWFLQFSIYTYSIYLLSKFFQVPARIICLDVLHVHWSICIISMFFVGICIPILICKIVEQYKPLRSCTFLRYIIGY